METDSVNPVKSITTRLDYEFAKYFLLSAEQEFQHLNESSDAGKYTKIAESKAGALGTLGEILGLEVAGAVGSAAAVTVVAAIEKLIKKRKKCFVISIIDANSSESFISTFRRTFIETGILAYQSYEYQMKNVYLKVGSGDRKKGDQRQAMQILGAFAGARCFEQLLESGSKENLLKALTIRSLVDRVASWLKSKTEEKLYFWVLKEDGIREKKYISAYNFFLSTVPVFDFSAGRSVNSTNATIRQVQVRKTDLKRTSSLRLSQKLRRPLTFELQASHSLRLAPLQIDNSGEKVEVTRFSEQQSKSKSMMVFVDEFFDALEHDESFSWSKTVLTEVQGIVQLLREQKNLMEDTNVKVTEARDGIKENNQILTQGLLQTDSKIEAFSSKLDKLIPLTSSIKCLPFSKVRFNVKDPIETFTGRDTFIKDLDTSIQNSRKEESKITVLSQISVVTGFGGIGKTETVRMYIHQFGAKYDHVVWIDAEDPSNAENQFGKLANNELKIPLTTHENNPLEFTDILKQTYQKLCSNKNLLLLVFDNAESLDSTEHHASGIRRFLPQSLSPSLVKPVILITSRNRNWAHQTVTNLGLWTKEECIVFVLKHLNLEDNEKNRFNSSALGHVFGLCPLALQSAVAVISQQSKRKQLVGGGSYEIQDLINDYQSGKRDVLSKLPLDSPSKTSMMVLWNVSLKKIRDHDHGELAIKILNAMAYMSPTVIPKELICALFKEDENNLADALVLLTDYSLVESFESHMTVHRMIQDVTIEHLQKETDENENSNNETQLLIHLTQNLRQFLTTLSKSSLAYDDTLTNVITVANHVSNKLSVPEFLGFTEYVADEITKIRTTEASKQFEKLIAHYKAKNGLSCKNTQKCLHQLAYISVLKGKFQEAFVDYSKLLEEQKSSWGEQDLDTLNTKNSLALVLYKQGKYDKSMKIYSEVLEHREKILGPSNILTLQTKHYYALVMKCRGNVENAMKLYWEILSVREKELGLTHPDTLTTKNSIANVMKNQCKYEEAIHLYMEVLEAKEKTLGPSDPSTLEAKHNLAMTVNMLGNFEEALQMILEVLEVQEKVFGPFHPSTLTTKNSEAAILENQGKYEKALEIYTEVLDAKIDVLGPNHPSTLITKNNMATVIECQGKLKEAIQMFSEVLEARNEVLGPSHPRTVKTKSHLNRLRFKIGEEKGAASFDEEGNNNIEILD